MHCLQTLQNELTNDLAEERWQRRGKKNHTYLQSARMAKIIDDVKKKSSAETPLGSKTAPWSQREEENEDDVLPMSPQNVSNEPRLQTSHVEKNKKPRRKQLLGHNADEDFQAMIGNT